MKCDGQSSAVAPQRSHSTATIHDSWSIASGFSSAHSSNNNTSHQMATVAIAPAPARAPKRDLAQERTDPNRPVKRPRRLNFDKCSFCRKDKKRVRLLPISAISGKSPEVIMRPVSKSRQMARCEVSAVHRKGIRMF